MKEYIIIATMKPFLSTKLKFTITSITSTVNWDIYNSKKTTCKPLKFTIFEAKRVLQQFKRQDPTRYNNYTYEIKQIN